MLTARQVRAIRLKHNISQYDFAELINVPVGTWSNVELGNTPFQKYMHTRVVKVLDDLDIVKADNIAEYIAQLEKDDLEFIKHQKARGGKRRVQKGEAPMDDKKLTLPNGNTHAIAPQPPTKEQMFQNIAQRVVQTLVDKNHDYGDSFHDVYKKFGDQSTFIRLSDKIGRLETLIKGGERVKDEPIEDVLEDIAGYCFLTLTSKERIKRGE